MGKPKEIVPTQHFYCQIKLCLIIGRNLIVEGPLYKVSIIIK